MRALWILALLVACGAPGRVAPVAQYPVQGREAFISSYDWMKSPWYRISDPSGGIVYILLTYNNRACVVSGPDYVMARDGELYACESGWREARRR